MTDQETKDLFQTAREVAGRSIGRYGLAYITFIVLIAAGSAYFLSSESLTPVMTVIGGALMALIQMLQGITGTREEPERPELKVVESLIEKVGKLALRVEPGMYVHVDEHGHVIVRHGTDSIEQDSLIARSDSEEAR